MPNFVPIRVAAEKLGLHPNTLRKLADDGKIPHYRTESGQRRFDVDSFLGISLPATTVCYCRVSSYKQREDLNRQVDYLEVRYPEAEIVKDIGSGINFKRKGLRSLLDRIHKGDKLKIVVAHRDRLARFGFELIEYMVQQNGGEIVVLSKAKDHSPLEEITQDLLSIIHVFSCRLHGLRKYKDQIKKDKEVQPPRKV